ncbi:MAG: glycosyltransferase family 39 protein [Chloroflexi bacterium]|nr:glycosyltransferase family 39 protein [Chloroflexota bacterium]
MRSPRNTQYTTPHPIRSLARPLTPPLILLLAALLRFYNLSGQSLWADEGNSVALARRSFVEIVQRTAFDIHPPFYYWLLKIWIAIFGDSEIGLRSLSVALGVGVVYLTGILGTRLFSPRVGLIAAFIAVLSPLQVYYSQEARMYMLLTLLSSLTVLAAFIIWQDDRRAGAGDWGPGTGNYKDGWFKTPAGWVYIFAGSAGLYTHYAYPLILLAVNLTFFVWLWQSRRETGRLEEVKPQTPNSKTHISNLQSPISNLQSQRDARQSQISNWLLLQLIPILLYLPWLPIAWRQITIWPSEKQSASFLTILETVLTTLLFGLSWPFDFRLILIVGLGLALVVTFKVQRSMFNLFLLWLWFLPPVVLTVFIFSPAFLKFLLVAAPALALLLAVTIEGVGCRVSGAKYHAHGYNRHTFLGYLAGGTLLAALVSGSAVSLSAYYTDPAYARDNYRGIANFIKAVAGPDDAVVLDAEGQQDVFNYYYVNTAPEAPVYPLPRRRPLDEAETVGELQTIVAKAGKVYAVYWATQQADPNGLIESWLDKYLFKATDQWYGNVRLVSYASPQASARLPLTPVDEHLGPHIRLVEYALFRPQITPGDILQLALSWETDASLSLAEDYTVFVQILDQANHVVGQRDARPLTPAPEWPVNKPVADVHGVFIEPGTPPGLHRLIVGLYNSQTGQRLPVEGGQDFIELGQIEIVRPATPLPLGAFNIQVPVNKPMLGVTLLGYDLYKLGHRSTPDSALQPGDPVQLVAYWAAHPQARELQDQLFIQVVTNGGEGTPIFMTRQPAGIDYPIQDWREGEIIRAQYNFFLTNLSPGIYRVALTLNGPAVSSQQATAVTKPFRIE